MQIFVDSVESLNSPVYSPPPCVYREIQLVITKHIVVELAQQITNSFMQWNKNSSHAGIQVNLHLPASPVKNWRILFYCPHALADGK